jgi:thiosulfate/3-mercaptopyruvate sulfurtransferase
MIKTDMQLISTLRASIAAIVLGAAFSANAAPAPQPLVSPAELRALIDQKAVRVLDIRELLQNDNKTPNYAAGHIPGAVAAPYSSLRGPDTNPGEVIPDRKLSALLGQWGITPDTHVVIAHTGADPSDFGGAARFYWTLKLVGVKKISILDGGLGAWVALKYPTQTETPRIEPTKFAAKIDRSQIATSAEILNLLKQGQSKKYLLTDSRPENYFLGEERHSVAARAGTLPGAKNFDHEEWFQLNTGKLLPKAQLESTAKREGLITDAEVVSFCNTGHWSATTWFVLSEILGRPNVRMYPESMIAWSRSRNPMDNEPAAKSRIDQLKDSTKKPGQ